MSTVLVQPPVCEHPGCNDSAIECWLPKDGEATIVPEELLCPVHAPEHGYCSCCGGFWAGIDSFDMNPAGRCEHCEDAIQADCADDGTVEALYET